MPNTIFKSPSLRGEGWSGLLSLLLLFFSLSLSAQNNPDLQKAMQKYKNMASLTANVTRTQHRTAVTKDVVSKGTFAYKKPSHVSMVFVKGQDEMLLEGNTFTIISGGKKTTTGGAAKNSKGDPTLMAFKTLLSNLLTGKKSDIDINDIADVDYTKSGNNMVITVEPLVTDPKAKRRQVFSSFILTIDLKAGELRSLRMNEKGRNFTQYDFSNFKIK